MVWLGVTGEWNCGADSSKRERVMGRDRFFEFFVRSWLDYNTDTRYRGIVEFGMNHRFALPFAGCCSNTPLNERPLLSPIQAGGLAAVFKVLANDTRLRLLHALIRADEMCVSDLAASVGMKPQAVSNQLQRLSDLGILAARRSGNNIHYRVVDRCVRALLDQGLCLMEEVHQRNAHDATQSEGASDTGA